VLVISLRSGTDTLSKSPAPAGMGGEQPGWDVAVLQHATVQTCQVLVKEALTPRRAGLIHPERANADREGLLSK
jgi:hypothetical protein